MLEPGLLAASVFPILSALLFVLGAVGCLVLARGSGAPDRGRRLAAAGFGLMAFNSLLSLVPMILLIQLDTPVRSVGVANLALSVLHTLLLIAGVALIVMGVVAGRDRPAAPPVAWAPADDTRR